MHRSGAQLRAQRVCVLWGMTMFTACRRQNYANAITIKVNCCWWLCEKPCVQSREAGAQALHTRVHTHMTFLSMPVHRWRHTQGTTPGHAHTHVHHTGTQDWMPGCVRALGRPRVPTYVHTTQSCTRTDGGREPSSPTPQAREGQGQPAGLALPPPPPPSRVSHFPVPPLPLKGQTLGTYSFSQTNHPAPTSPGPRLSKL